MFNLNVVSIGDVILMKILIEIAQQTNVHFFKNIIKQLSDNGHSVCVVARDRELTLELLRKYNIPHQSLSRAALGQFGKLRELVFRAMRMCVIIRRFQPDVLFTRSYSLILAGKLMRRPVIFDTDDGKAVGRINFQIMRMADLICTPESLGDQFGQKQIRYPGYKELAYLHPNNFETEKNIRQDLGLMDGERYFILRFTSLQAFHDVHRKGMSWELKSRLIRLLSERGRVYISGETDLPDEWRKFRFPLSPNRIHSALYYADLYAGDSGTMASEAAVLGTPAIFMLTFEGTLYYLKELEEKYGLLFSFRHDQEGKCLEVINNLVDMTNLKETWAVKRSRMLEDKIDVADYYVKLIESRRYSNGMPGVDQIEK